MQNKEMDQEKSVNEKNLEVFNRYFPGCLSIENDNQLTLDTKKVNYPTAKAIGLFLAS
ncbi:hypothetical protein HMPREF1443_00269 [Helicobacter pylori HP250BFi]|nr:hypothetical protein HMPREF1443_00269 [Helicobacter pylori HP250BFi]